MCDRIEFKLYSPFNKEDRRILDLIKHFGDGTEDIIYRNVYYDYATAYEVRPAVLINGGDIIDIVLNKAKGDFDPSYRYVSPGALYKELTKESFSRAFLGIKLENMVSPLGKLFCWRDLLNSSLMNKLYVLEEDDEQFVYWHLIGTGRKPITEKKWGKPIQFKFAKEQYHEALGHLQQLIGKDIDESQFTKPLLIEHLKTQLYKLKKRRIEEERRRAKEQAEEKIELEIKEKLEQAEKNGTDVIEAFELGKLYYQYLDYDNAILWFNRAAEMGSAAKRSKAGDSALDTCDRIKFEPFYSYGKEFICEDDYFGFDGSPVEEHGWGHYIVTEIYINDDKITGIMGAKWRDKCPDYAHLCPWKLFDALINKQGFMGGWNWRKDMPVWKDGGIVRNILRPFYLQVYLDYNAIDDNDFLMVSEKEDEEFVYWRIINPSEITDPDWLFYGEADKIHLIDYVDDTTGKNDLFFKFAKEQYYTELSKLAKWCDLLKEDEDRAIDTETDGNKAYEIGRMYYKYLKDYSYDIDDKYVGYYVAKALKWFYKAADLGNTDAMLCIAMCYLFGWGVPEDKEQAMAWFDEAYKVGGGRPNEKHLPGKLPSRGVYADTNWHKPTYS